MRWTGRRAVTCQPQPYDSALAPGGRSRRRSPSIRAPSAPCACSNTCQHARGHPSGSHAGRQREPLWPMGQALGGLRPPAVSVTGCVPLHSWTGRSRFAPQSGWGNPWGYNVRRRDLRRRAGDNPHASAQQYRPEADAGYRPAQVGLAAGTHQGRDDAAPPGFRPSLRLHNCSLAPAIEFFVTANSSAVPRAIRGQPILQSARMAPTQASERVSNYQTRALQYQ